MCDKVVFVTKLCVNHGWRWRSGRGAEEGGYNTKSKTRTPHKDVGKKQKQNKTSCSLAQSPRTCEAALGMLHAGSGPIPAG